MYIFAVLIYGLGVLIFGLSIACPLEIMSCSNAFSTPLEIVPEWYLLLCFNLLRIVTSKGIEEPLLVRPLVVRSNGCNTPAYKTSGYQNLWLCEPMVVGPLVVRTPDGTNPDCKTINCKNPGCKNPKL